MRYGRSHMWLGAHLLVLLIVAVSLGLKASLLAAWANILAILSLLAAPFWFNPFSLDWQVNKVGGELVRGESRGVGRKGRESEIGADSEVGLTTGRCRLAGAL